MRTCHWKANSLTAIKRSKLRQFRRDGLPTGYLGQYRLVICSRWQGALSGSLAGFERAEEHICAVRSKIAGRADHQDLIKPLVLGQQTRHQAHGPTIGSAIGNQVKAAGSGVVASRNCGWLRNAGNIME